MDQRNILQLNRRCQTCAPEELKTLDLTYDNGSDDGGDTVRTVLGASSKDNQYKVGSIDDIEDTVSLVQTEESSLRRDSASNHGDWSARPKECAKKKLRPEAQIKQQTNEETNRHTDRQTKCLI